MIDFRYHKKFFAENGENGSKRLRTGANGKDIEMTAENWSKENVYVKELYVNGKKCDKSYLTYDEIRNGVKLRFVMSEQPNRRRAVSDEAVPPSLLVQGKTLKYQQNAQNSPS